MLKNTPKPKNKLSKEELDRTLTAQQKKKLLSDDIDLSKCSKKELLYAIKINEFLLSRQYETVQDLRKSVNWQQNIIDENKIGAEALAGKFYDIRQELEKQLEDCQKQKTEAIRAYQGLAQMGKFAEDMGIDLEKACEELPESEKNKYDFSQKHTVLESGRVKHEYNLKPKVKPKEGKGHYYFGKWYPDKKPKKPNGKGPK